MSAPRQDDVPVPLPVLTQVALEALISAIPGVGPLLVGLASGYRNEVRFRHLERFLREFKERLEAMGEDKLDARYARSEEYALYVMRAAEIAASTHRESKIGLLAAVAAGAAAEGATDIWRDKFLTVIDQVGPEHITVLRAITGSEAWLDQRDDVAGATTLGERLPGVSRSDAELLTRDLVGLGLAQDVGAGRLGVGASQVFRATTIGGRFLEFLLPSGVAS